MSWAVQLASMLGACASGGVAGSVAFIVRNNRRRRALRREDAFGEQVVRARKLASASRYDSFALRYAESLNRRLLAGATAPLSPSVAARRAGKTRAGLWYKSQSVPAGCSKDITVSAYCEARLRLAVIGSLVGALVGVPISTGLAVVLGLVGGLAGGTAMGRAVRTQRRVRGACAERHLSEMLEVVALGLRSGLTFDRSFALYGSHFDNEFARSCARAYRSWSLGLAGREEALRELANSYDCDQLGRIVDSIVRGLRFGSSLTGVLEESAVQARASYRTGLEERVAKAPVKMMLPTGTLILPAMLLLVMGPVLLELLGGF